MLIDIKNIELVPVELDFSASGGGRHSATAVAAEGIRLFNALELVDVQPAATQVEICESCGYSHCSSGGWVTFRRVGHGVVWLPAWEEMEKGDWEASEYGPPAFLATKGVPVFSQGCWERLRALHVTLPPSQEIPHINSREAARLVQWSAPGQVLGEYPTAPRVRSDLIVTVTDGDATAEVAAVDRCLEMHFATALPMEGLPEDAAVTPIEFWLDLPGNPSWKPFAHVGDQTCFNFNGTHLLVR